MRFAMTALPLDIIKSWYKKNSDIFFQPQISRSNFNLVKKAKTSIMLFASVLTCLKYKKVSSAKA